MPFTLEVLQAAHGDCLLIHFGTKTTPKTMLIDGGPSGIYDHYLLPRLLEIKNNLGLQDALYLSMVMVSHIDDDHIEGICRLTDDMISNGAQSPVLFDHLWLNTFDDIIGNIQLPAISSIPATSDTVALSTLNIPNIQNVKKHIAAVIASTGQGRQLRDNSHALSLTLNSPFKKMGRRGAVLVRGDAASKPIKWEGVKITVLTPDQKRLTALQKKWDKDLKKAQEKGDDSIILASITNPDNSPFNLSSITCLIEKGKKKMLLTGDARTEDILEGLQTNRLLNSKGKMHVHILKIPHHGSSRNMHSDFLDVVTADHYVISANGRDDNPDRKLLKLLLNKVKKGTVYFTNNTGKKTISKDINSFRKKIKSTGSKLKVEILPEGHTSFKIDLANAVTF